MAKKPVTKKRGVSRQDTIMNRATQIFLAGCAGEIYLTLIRRYYLYGTVEQILAWDSALKVLAVIGLIVAAAGIAWTLLWKKQGRKLLIPLIVAGAGAFIGAVSWIAAWKMTLVNPMIALVPAAMLLALLWILYDRVSALSLTILGVSLIGVWMLRKVYNHLRLGTPGRVILILYLAAVILCVLFARRGRLRFLLPEKADLLPLYISAALSAIAIAVSLANASAAYYAMWGLAAALFALAVYYTVKQL